jgi:hypothetical protein
MNNEQKRHPFLLTYIQNVPGGKVNILVGHGIGHCKQKKYVFTRVLFPTVSEMQYTVHCTEEQHAMSSHELQSALMLAVEFWKIYYTR